MKHLLIITFSLLLTFTAKSQTPPVLDINIMGGAGCESDLLIRVHAIYNIGTVVATSNWFNASMLGGSVSWSVSDVATNVGWAGPGPGTWNATTNDYFFGQFDIQNCNTPSTGPTTLCIDNNFDGTTIYTNGNPSDCFEYSNNCGTCLTGQVIEVNCGNNFLNVNY